MPEFLNRLGELKWVIRKIRIFEVLLDSILLLVLFSFLLFALNLPVLYAFAPPFGYLLMQAGKRRNLFRSIESRSDDLKERLECAYDNRDLDSVVARSLFRDVASLLANTRHSLFVDDRKIAVKVVFSVLIAFAFLLFTFLNVKPLNVPELAEEAVKQIAEKEAAPKSLAAGGILGAFDFGKPNQTQEAASELFGMPSIAKIEGEKIQMEIYLGGGELNLREVKREEREFLASPSFPVEATAAETFAENVPEKHEKVVRQYFEQVAKAG